MIKAATRTTLVKEYFFSQKLKQIEQMNKSGEQVINLGIGNPDLMPPDNVVQELTTQVVKESTNGYQSYKGINELREAFSQWYSEFYNVSLNPDTEILPLIGSKEGIMHISMAYLNVGDKVLVPNPGYPTYSSVSKIVGAEIVSYDLLDSNNWLPDFDQLEKIASEQDIKLMWVNYPNMPTGQPASIELYKQLVAFGKKHNILICNDNPYSFILNDEQLSILSIPGADEVCLELNSLSKSHNMAGFRVGMVAGKEEFIQNILKIKSNMDSGMYKPLQLAAVQALKNGREWYSSINETYKVRRELVYEMFDLLGATYSKSQVGMFVWAKIPDNYNTAIEFSDYYLEKSRVFITPGNIFGSNGDKYARISLCTKEASIKLATEKLKQALK